jgi:hypothetical protein
MNATMVVLIAAKAKPRDSRVDPRVGMDSVADISAPQNAVIDALTTLQQTQRSMQ